MNIDITNVIIALMGVLSAVVTAVLVPWIKSKLNVNQIDIIRQLATVAVYAAQQLYDSTDAEEKKAYAMSYVEDELENRGIKISMDIISTYIEAALKDIKTSLNTDKDW